MSISFVSDFRGLRVHFSTERLSIRSFETKDYLEYRQLLSDREVCRYYALRGFYTPKEISEMARKILDAWSKGSPSAFAVLLENRLIGVVEVKESSEPGIGWISYAFSRSHWRRGFGFEAVDAVVRDVLPAMVNQGILFG